MKDGSLAPLFINKRQRLEQGRWYAAEAHRTKGFAFRPGWHVCCKPEAPHLSEKGRVWRKVEVEDYIYIERPVQQGKTWMLANKMQIIREI